MGIISEIFLKKVKSNFYLLSAYVTKQNFLQTIDLMVISNEECKTVIPSITDDHVCATGLNFKSICTGDGGSPLVIRDEQGPFQIGFASFIYKNDCMAEIPSIFTRITRFLDWIENVSGIAY